MKKARFIGVLMAAVMAAVPFAGNAKTSFNSLNANADGKLSASGYLGDNRSYYKYSYGYALTDYDSKGYAVNSFKNKIYGYTSLKTYGYGTVFQNGNTNQAYKLTFSDGRLQIEKRINVSVNILEAGMSGVYVPIWSFNTGGETLAFQNDGNMVVYDKNGNPTAHTCTYDTSKTTARGYQYRYILTSSGKFQIWRISPRNLGSREELIWDSSRNKMYRI